MTTLRLSEAVIRERAAAESFRRGEEYERRGAVVSLVRRGDRLMAEVEGSEPEPYRVAVRFDAAGVVDAVCSCPYAWGGWCKHIVAALLVALHDPDAVEERPTVEALLASLDDDRLRALVLELVEREPALADVIERLVAAPSGGPGGGEAAASPPPTGRSAPTDVGAIRREVRSILHGGDQSRGWDAYWAVGRSAGDGGDVPGRAATLIAAGDGRGALTVLDAVTDELLADWEMWEDVEGDVDELYGPLGIAWTEAILSAELTADEREEWADKLADWAEELADYGFDDVFGPALAALGREWDGGPMEEPSPYAEALATARLNLLERSGQVEEFLRVAAETGMTERRATMLVRLGRVEEAVEAALAGLTTADGAFAVARVLREYGEPARALDVGERGLSLEGEKAALAGWLRDLALGLGEAERALPAALVAFREAPDLGSYLGVREAAGEGWPGQREAALAQLRRFQSWDVTGKVEVLLHENLVGEAIAAVEKSYDDRLVARVAAAAVESHPDWVIRAARKRAEAIIDPGRASHYDEAVDWLRTARDAFVAADREPEWLAYLEELTDRHRRKHKLRPMLEALRR